MNRYHTDKSLSNAEHAVVVSTIVISLRAVYTASLAIVFGPKSSGRRRDQSSYVLSIFRNVLLATPLHDSLHYCPQQHWMPLTTMNMPSQ
ncbi:MAG TPA: hypothetical protein VFR94_14045 [Nitrososphaeraceae archaeon]|nr:hypothetical protein [Nitrososphaeraceae archaeon]